MQHRIEIDTRKFPPPVLNVAWGPLRRGEPFTVETEALTLEMLLTPQVIIDGQTFESRMGWPEPQVAAPMATRTIDGI